MTLHPTFSLDRVPFPLTDRGIQKRRPIQELAATGLPKPCLVRFKLFSLDERLILGSLGQLATEDRAGVAAHLRQLMPLV